MSPNGTMTHDQYYSLSYKDLERLRRPKNTKNMLLNQTGMKPILQKYNFLFLYKDYTLS